MVDLGETIPAPLAQLGGEAQEVHFGRAALAAEHDHQGRRIGRVRAHVLALDVADGAP